MTTMRAAGRPVAAGIRPDETQARLAVILVNWNRWRDTVECLESLLRADGRFHIIVVDNGSRMSLAPVAEAWPMVRFLSCHEPGPGPARNHGIAAARADVLAFIDADVRVLPGWLQAGLDALQSAPGPVGGDVRIDTADPHRLSGVEAFECVFAFRQKFYIERRQYSVTANLIMTRAMFDAAGPFGGIDTAEDRLFGERARAAGPR
jgi:glycosyltransferase involved in cell wall biosynthesis